MHNSDILKHFFQHHVQNKKMWVFECKQMLEDNIVAQKAIHSPIYYLTA
jgi:hypothetical protein